MVEGLRDYPHAGVWYLGLLLVRPAQRSQGIGARFVRACEALARAEGAVEMRLCVFDTSPRAWQFWLGNGYSVYGSVAPTRFGSRDHARTEMRKLLAPT